MTNLEERAEQMLDDWITSNGTSEDLERLVVSALREQDKITRHACAENTAMARSWLAEWESVYNDQHKMFGEGSDLSADIRCSRLCGHILGVLEGDDLSTRGGTE